MAENKNYSVFENRIGYKFRNEKLLRTVFTHRSYINEHKGMGLNHNERLEFLGDAVLELVVTEYLYRNYPEPEGVLTSWRSALVRGTSLSDVAKVIGIDDFMMMSRGESKSVGKSRAVILANAVEALIGALYIDSDIDAANKFVHKYIIKELEDIIKHGKHKDAKSSLQETTQEKEGLTPQYKLDSESGPDHAKVFVASVWIGNNKIAFGEGASKREAEQAAAQSALKKFK